MNERKKKVLFNDTMASFKINKGIKEEYIALCKLNGMKYQTRIKQLIDEDIKHLKAIKK